MVIINQYEACKILKQIASQFSIYVKGNSLNEEIHRIDKDEIKIDEDTDILINLNHETNGLR